MQLIDLERDNLIEISNYLQRIDFFNFIVICKVINVKLKDQIRFRRLLKVMKRWPMWRFNSNYYKRFYGKFYPRIQMIDPTWKWTTFGPKIDLLYHTSLIFDEIQNPNHIFMIRYRSQKIMTILVSDCKMEQIYFKQKTMYIYHWNLKTWFAHDAHTIYSKTIVCKNPNDANSPQINPQFVILCGWLFLQEQYSVGTKVIAKPKNTNDR
jgi:hypothetical protein